MVRVLKYVRVYGENMLKNVTRT